jgi:hypothetical protein
VCGLCGARLRPISSDLSFKIGVRAIVILRALPVLQCEGCTQYLIEDPVFARVEEILDRVGADAELEVIRFAA